MDGFFGLVVAAWLGEVDFFDWNFRRSDVLPVVTILLVSPHIFLEPAAMRSSIDGWLELFFFWAVGQAGLRLNLGQTAVLTGVCCVSVFCLPKGQKLENDRPCAWQRLPPFAKITATTTDNRIRSDFMGHVIIERTFRID